MRSNLFIGGKDAWDFNLNVISSAHINNNGHKNEIKCSFDIFQISKYSEKIKIFIDHTCLIGYRFSKFYFLLEVVDNYVFR